MKFATVQKKNAPMRYVFPAAADRPRLPAAILLSSQVTLARESVVLASARALMLC
eukprot:COSAG05_NODE_22315_length_265_cov_1.542169_1_plen_54_part_01